MLPLAERLYSQASNAITIRVSSYTPRSARRSLVSYTSCFFIIKPKSQSLRARRYLQRQSSPHDRPSCARHSKHSGMTTFYVGNYFICVNGNASEARSFHESIIQNDDIVADPSKLPRSNQVSSFDRVPLAILMDAIIPIRETFCQRSPCISI